MAIFFSRASWWEQQPPAELKMGQTFLVAPDILLEQLPELGVFLAADQVQLHGEFIRVGIISPKGWSSQSRSFCRPVAARR